MLGLGQVPEERPRHKRHGGFIPGKKPAQTGASILEPQLELVDRAEPRTSLQRAFPCSWQQQATRILTEVWRLISGEKISAASFIRARRSVLAPVLRSTPAWASAADERGDRGQLALSRPASA